MKLLNGEVSTMNVIEYHSWLDLCEHEDQEVREHAQKIVDEWNKDLQAAQMWRLKEKDDEVVCIVLDVGKKVRVEVDTYDQVNGSSKKIAYFSKKAFLKNWKRMY